MRQEGNNQEGPIISSVYTFHNDNEFVPVPCQELNRRSAEFSGRTVLERDPLEVNSYYHQSATANIAEEVITIKSEPASDNDEETNISAVNLNHGSVMCPMPTSSLFLSIPVSFKNVLNCVFCLSICNSLSVTCIYQTELIKIYLF